MIRAITARKPLLLAACAACAAALSVPTLTASAHVPCGKQKPRHTNCGKHLGQLKHRDGATGATGTTGTTGATGATGASGPGERGRDRDDDARGTADGSSDVATDAKHAPCGQTKPKHTNCGKHKGASKGKKKGHSK